MVKIRADQHEIGFQSNRSVLACISGSLGELQQVIDFAPNKGGVGMEFMKRASHYRQKLIC